MRNDDNIRLKVAACTFVCHLLGYTKLVAVMAPYHIKSNFFLVEIYFHLYIMRLLLCEISYQ